jgi:hypothetical protein
MTKCKLDETSAPTVKYLYERDGPSHAFTYTL